MRCWGWRGDKRMRMEHHRMEMSPLLFKEVDYGYLLL